MQALPIDPYLPAIMAELSGAGVVCLCAEPGAGKTTRVPRAMLDAGFSAGGEILVLQPRRIAARMSAARVAQELGERLGERIGFQVRMQERVSPRTRVRFITEGLLVRRLVEDPKLNGIGAVVLDEFHERSLQADLCLALLRRLRRTHRPDLRLVVMSATLNSGPISAFLDASTIEVPGRLFKVEIEHAGGADKRPLEQRVRSCVAGALRQGLRGDVLVFLPGAAEIRRAQRACAELCARANMELATLHGDLPPDEQDRAVTPGSRPKLILATNVAETSLTLEGVDTVVDSGLQRQATHSPFSGLPTLTTVPISRASATQRAGRAGRVREGRCLRLYTKHDHDSRPAQDLAEIQRADLSDLLLTVHAGGKLLERHDWLESPPDKALQRADALLHRLGALSAGKLSTLGQRMLRFPLHPRLSRLVIEAENRGVGRAGCALAALLSERDISLSARTRFDEHRADVLSGPSDALDRLDALQELEDTGFSKQRARALEIDLGAARAVARLRGRYARQLSRGSPAAAASEQDHEEAILMSALVGFSDRVAMRRDPSSDVLLLCQGGTATQSPHSVVRDEPLCVVLDATDKRGRSGSTVAHWVSKIEPEWLLELFPDRVTETNELRYDAARDRMVARVALHYGKLVLDESLRDASQGADVEALLAEIAHNHGLASLWDMSEIESLLLRWEYASSPGQALTAPAPDALQRAVAQCCSGCTSLAELKTRDLVAALRSQLPKDQWSVLERRCPKELRLPGGRRLRISYERDQAPWVSSRLQDFFGMKEGPRVADEPLVLHLLAPNRRAVQVTTDLAGFWERHYPTLRKQLMRRYPKHAWPEDPLAARPPPPAGRRR